MPIWVCLIFLQSVQAQDVEVKVESKITKATVFLNGGQIFRSTKTRVPAGRSVLVFDNLDFHLAAQTVQLSTTPGLNVLSVSTRHDYLGEAQSTDEADRLNRLKQVKEDSLEIEKLAIGVYTLEMNMLLENQSIGTTTTGVDLGQLRASADFFRERLTEIKRNQLQHQKRTKQLGEEIVAIERQLLSLEQKHRGTATAEIVVVVEAARAGEHEFSLNYVTPQANWHPLYDFRVEDVDSPLALHYKANIVQTTGETWEDVRLTLSTANPFQNNNKPELSVWQIGYPQQFQAKTLGRFQEGVVAADEAWEDDLGNSWEPTNSDGQLPAPVAVQVSNTTSAEFQIPIPYTVASVNEPTLVVIATHRLEAEYEYYIAPSKRREAFLTSQFSGWEDLNLLSGNVNLFFNNTFIGQTYLNTEHVDDSLKTSLGIDEGITVSRKRVKDRTSKRILGGKKTDSFGYEVQVRNNKQVPVTVVVEEQIPVSTDSSIEVSLEESDDAVYDEISGKLRWKRTIEPAQTLDLSFGYNVRYPRGRRVDY